VQVSYVRDVEDYDPLAPVPRYRQIANIIRRRIESGELQPERPIPSEAQIMEEFGVARATARHAAELLRDEGLVVKVPGLGTFVRKPEAWHTSR
jgi:GntR family transcriptional regulator